MNNDTKATTGGKAAPSYTPRVVGFSSPHELRCPRGHHIRRDSVVLDDAVLMCKHREPLAIGKGGGPECGKLLYVCLGWAPRGSDVSGSLWFVAEVSYAEAKQMQDQRLDLAGVLRFLGVQFPVTALSST